MTVDLPTPLQLNVGTDHSLPHPTYLPDLPASSIYTPFVLVADITRVPHTFQVTVMSLHLWMTFFRVMMNSSTKTGIQKLQKQLNKCTEVYGDYVYVIQLSRVVVSVNELIPR